MSLPINLGGIYHYVLRDAQTGEVVLEGEKHNIITLDGWKNFLNVDFAAGQSDFEKCVLVLCAEEVNEDESVVSFPSKTIGTKIEFFVNEEEDNVPKNFVYHFSFPVPSENTEFKVLGLYNTLKDKIQSITVLDTPIMQLGETSPTPQILDLYYTLYFDYDRFAEIEHSKKGSSVLSQFIDIFSIRQPNETTTDEQYMGLKLNEAYATHKNLSPNLSQYNVRSNNDMRKIDVPHIISDFTTDYTNIFKKVSSVSMLSTGRIGRILGSVGVQSSNISWLKSPVIDFGIIWPISQNPAITPVQNIFSHKQPTPTNPDIPFYTKFRSTGKILFDDTLLDVSGAPKWYQINFKNTGNAADENVRFEVSESNFLGFTGNAYFANSYSMQTYTAASDASVRLLSNLVYQGAIASEDGLEDHRTGQSLYDGQHVLWFSKTHIVKQNVFTGEFKQISSMTNPIFVANNITQVAIHTDAFGVQTFFVGCRNSGIWILDNELSLIKSVDVSVLTDIESKCYGISMGYGGTIWAILEGGMVQSTDLGETWTQVVFTMSGVSNDNWNRVGGLYACQGTNDNKMLVVVREDPEGELSDLADFVWYRNDTDTVGITIPANGYRVSNGPRQIHQVPGFDVLLVMPEYVSGKPITQQPIKLTFEDSGYIDSLYTPLLSGSIDVLFDKLGNYFIVKNFIVDFNSPIQSIQITSSYSSNILYQVRTFGTYRGFIMLSRRSPIFLGIGSSDYLPVLISGMNSLLSYESPIRDLLVTSYRYNQTSSLLEKDYTYPAIDITSNSYDGVRLNFKSEDIEFNQGSLISLKPHVSNIGSKLTASGEFTIAMMVRPNNKFYAKAQLATADGRSGNAITAGILDFIFDHNKTALQDNSFSLFISPNIQISSVNTDGLISNHVFSANVIGTAKGIFDTDKTTRVVLTFANSTLKLYVNGMQLGVDCVSCSALDFSQLTDIVFGQTQNRSYGFNGLLDHIQIWDKAFTADDVAFDFLNNNYATKTASITYNPATTLQESNLLLLYRLSDMLINNKETAVVDDSTIYHLSKGLAMQFADNTNVNTSFYDTDFYTFGVCDGLLKDEQIVFAEDYFMTFIK